MNIAVLRIGHRMVRDDRVTTHVALVARAFGADAIYMTGILDGSITDTVANVSKTWGGRFRVEVIQDWKGLVRAWKKEGGKVAHLTMYGINVDDIAGRMREENKILVIVGAEKVPQEAYGFADYNIAIGNQPHSEIAALAIFLDRIFAGKQFKRVFADANIKIVPSEKGKKVQENSE
ncbi:MAG TPA: tRNA (cytidine(56)-2'-O)-methyltransferase [Nitrososphaera sp.]|jgi:tRNA (cytidine56-2'-O)-methyltransferase|nr:tRNA (cytidine(56)-2'-O)-methyltransferase [Nitrososphaera sp.]